MRIRRSQVVAIVVIVAVIAGFVFTLKTLSSPYIDMRNQAIGASVAISGTNVPKTIKAVATEARQDVAEEIQSGTSIIKITPAGVLPATVTLDFKLSRQVSKDEVVLVETRETSNGPWSLVPATISADGWHANVQTNHLSDWWAGILNPSAVISFLRTHLLDGLTGDLTTEASPPKCDNDYYHVPSSQHDNYTIGSGSKFQGNPLYWCFGVESGQRVLKIVNRMRYPLQVSHPGFTFLRTEGQFQGLGLDLLAGLAAGKDTILFPFETAVYSVDLPPGATATIQTDFANLAIGLSMFEDLVTWFIGAGAFVENNSVTTVKQMTAGIIQDGKSVTFVLTERTMTFRTYGILANVMKFLLDARDCVGAIVGLIKTHDVGTAISRCWDTATKLFKGINPVVAAVVGAIFTATQIAETIRGWFDVAHDSAFDLANYFVNVGRTQVSVVQPPTPPTPTPPTPTPPTPAPQPPTPTPTHYYESTSSAGSPTFTNYMNAGGTLGPRVPGYTTIEVSCRLTGFKVADGNTWWYRIKSAPWSDTFYASADNYYNNGQTSGSLVGTPFVDTKVPVC